MPQMAARHSGIFNVVIEYGCRIDTVMPDTGEFAVMARTQSGCLNGCRLVADHRIHLSAGELEADRPVHHFRGESGQQSVRPGPGLAAESPSQELADDIDFFLRNTEHLRSELLCADDHLSRIDRKSTR